MSFTTASANQLIPLSVFGTAYVPERHSECVGSFADGSEVDQLTVAVTGLWASFFAAIGISLMNGQAASTIH